jgi:ribosome-associated protein
MRDVGIREGTIRLGQFLKLAGLTDAGGDAKVLIALGEVTVNGAVETRRGRQLGPGDIVTVGPERVRVTGDATATAGPADAEGASAS